MASEESKRLYSRGLVALQAGRHAQALELFERAAKADPEDVYALYYRGVTRGRTGDFAGAIADLRAVTAKTSIAEAGLELGVVLVHAGRYGEAIPWLERAQGVTELEGRASLFLGIAQLRLQQLGARQNFLRAARDPQLQVPARYYQGVVAYREGNWSQAEQQFSFVAAQSPDSAMGREAASFLARIRQGRGSEVQLYGALGFQYDSNVLLAPSDDVVKDALRISKQADGRVTVTLGGSYAALQTDRMELSLGYEFYQSLHFDLTEFNIQDHRPSVQTVVDGGFFQLGLLGRYDYYFLDTDSFLQEATVLPWIAVAEGDRGRTELFYRFRRRDFLQRSFSDLRDADNHAPGIRQFLYLGSPQRYVVVGYRFDREEANKGAGELFAYDGHEANGGIGWLLPAGVAVQWTFSYRIESYDEASNGRRDDEQQVLFGASKQLSDRVALTAAYLGTVNSSNQAEFDYDRHIGSVALEVRLY